MNSVSSTSESANISLVGLTKRYGPDAEPAIDDVSLDIAKGEFMTLLGPSGSGKTTTLNIVAGFVAPSCGNVFVDGVDIADLPPHRRNLGFVFQNYALFPHMTVAQNIAYPLRRRQIARADISRRVSEITEVVQLGDLSARRPRDLSGGQQQRVALARALAFNPRALLLDEPLAALDRQLRESLQDELRRLHRELGMTILLVTHDQQEALHLSDRIAVFDKGVIRQVGSPKELYERPESAFVASFLGESTFLPGTVETGSVATAAGRLPLRTGSSFQLGENIAVVIRPEAVTVTSAHVQSSPADVVRPATVSDLVYRGASLRVSAVVADGVTVLCSLPVSAAEGIAIGDPVRVSWNEEDAAYVRISRPPNQANVHTEQFVPASGGLT